jgi:hypothetical protein
MGEAMVRVTMGVSAWSFGAWCQPVPVTIFQQRCSSSQLSEHLIMIWTQCKAVPPTRRRLKGRLQPTSAFEYSANGGGANHLLKSFHLHFACHGFYASAHTYRLPPEHSRILLITVLTSSQRCCSPPRRCRCSPPSQRS